MDTLAKLEKLRANVHTMTLDFNDNRTNGDTVQGYLDSMDCAYDIVGEVPEDGRLIELMVYPRTSVCFCMWVGSDIDPVVTAALDYLFGAQWREGGE